MIHAVELENFKAFGSRVRLEFAPITLVYGENSAGKSSILNALNLLKQTRFGRGQGALLLPRAEGGLVDLGSFHELLHDHDPRRTLSVRVDMQNSVRQFRRGEDDEGSKSIGLEMGFRQEGSGDVALSSLHAYSGVPSEAVARFEPHELQGDQLRQILRRFSPYSVRRNGRGFTRPRGASCAEVTASDDYWAGEYRRALHARVEIIEALTAMRDDLSRNPGEGQGRLFPDADVSEGSVDRAIRFYESSFSLSVRTRSAGIRIKMIAGRAAS